MYENIQYPLFFIKKTSYLQHLAFHIYSEKLEIKR